MYLHIIDISSKHSDQANKLSTYENRLDNMSNNKKINTNFDMART